MLLACTNKHFIGMYVYIIIIIIIINYLINKVATNSFSFYPYYLRKWAGRGREGRLFDILVLGIGAYSGKGAY